MSLAGGDVGGQSYSAVNLTRRFYWTACLEATLCRMTQRLKQSGVFFHRFSCRWVARCAWWPHSSSVNCWGRRKPRPPWTSGRGLPSWTQVRHTHRCCCADVLTCRRSSWSCVCLFSSDDLPKKKPPLLYKPSNPDTLAYLDFSVSTTGMLAGVKVHVNSPPENQ